MGATKTTFHLDDDLRLRLKEVAARSGRSVTELLSEGAALVLANHEARDDAETLRRRSEDAWNRLCAGLYSGPASADAADDLIYSSPR